MRIAHLFPAVAALSLIAGTALASLPPADQTLAQDAAPAAKCSTPDDAVAFVQSKIPVGPIAEKHLHLVGDGEQDFAKAMVATGAPKSVLDTDEVVVVRVKLPGGGFATSESVQFYRGGCKTEGGFVPSAVIDQFTQGA